MKINKFDNYGVFELCKVEEQRYEIIKTRSPCYCNICEKKTGPGFYVIGSGEEKICLECANKFLNRSIKSLKGIMDKISLTKKQLELNKDKYLKNNVANSL